MEFEVFDQNLNDYYKHVRNEIVSQYNLNPIAFIFYGSKTCGSYINVEKREIPDNVVLEEIHHSDFDVCVIDESSEKYDDEATIRDIEYPNNLEVSLTVINSKEFEKRVFDMHTDSIERMFMMNHSFVVHSGNEYVADIENKVRKIVLMDFTRFAATVFDGLYCEQVRVDIEALPLFSMMQDMYRIPSMYRSTSEVINSDLFCANLYVESEKYRSLFETGFAGRNILMDGDDICFSMQKLKGYKNFGKGTELIAPGIKMIRREPLKNYAESSYFLDSPPEGISDDEIKKFAGYIGENISHFEKLESGVYRFKPKIKEIYNLE